MAQYAIAFDLDTKSMAKDDVSDTERTGIYQTEIPNALAECGFTAHPQGSLYHTECEEDSITCLVKLQSVLRAKASRFCQYVRRVHVFRMEEWSDVTPLLSSKVAAGTPTAEEELEKQEELDKCTTV